MSPRHRRFTRAGDPVFESEGARTDPRVAKQSRTRPGAVPPPDRRCGTGGRGHPPLACSAPATSCPSAPSANALQPLLRYLRLSPEALSQFEPELTAEAFAKVQAAQSQKAALPPADAGCAELGPRIARGSSGGRHHFPSATAHRR
jgi:hypothetical protein